MDTIFALATAQGRAGVAVIRVSGPHVIDAASEFMDNVPVNRGVRRIYTTDKELLDQALIVRFPEGKSFTGEDTIEFHLHGSIAIIDTVLKQLSRVENLRHAEPGEFTRRAMDNGMLDLTQIEGLADLIDAETEEQRKQAVRVFSGSLGQLVEKWRANLIRAASLLEATIDFVDEDVPIDVYPEVQSLLSEVRKDMQNECEGVLIAERIRSGFEIAIIGRPNVGKSTLLNKLANREAAITSEVAGTTRDVIEVQMDLSGLPVTVLDTAGLRETDDIVENIGVKRGIERAEMADLRVHMLIDDDRTILDVVDQDIVVYAKSDINKSDAFSISSKTDENIDVLIRRITNALKDKMNTIGIATRERHRMAMVNALEYINKADGEIESANIPVDMIAEELRSAIRAIDSLVGRIDVEHILGEIFSSFCIGK